ncbi:hypothetical protein HRbin28_01311 [bacterium HR28]|nr:hypothetical protein HRbin28_01311 [bacterium HR28]
MDKVIPRLGEPGRSLGWERSREGKGRGTSEQRRGKRLRANARAGDEGQVNSQRCPRTEAQRGRPNPEDFGCCGERTSWWARGNLSWDALSAVRLDMRCAVEGPRG